MELLQLNKIAILRFSLFLVLALTLTFLAGIEIGYQRGQVDANLGSARLRLGQYEALGESNARPKLYSMFIKEARAEVVELSTAQKGRFLVLSWSELENARERSRVFSEMGLELPAGADD